MRAFPFCFKMSLNSMSFPFYQVVLLGAPNRANCPINYSLIKGSPEEPIKHIVIINNQVM